jgi:TIR domain-containing protein
MPDVFISYARGDEAFVSRLRRALIEAGKDVWLDFEEISPTAGWLEEVEHAIDSAPALAFVISPDSLASDHCAQELERAIALGKRIVPVLRRDPNRTPVPDSLAQEDWISMREGDDFDAGFRSLISLT